VDALAAHHFRTDLWRAGVLIGGAFGAEFFFLFVALDQTTLVRASVLFYAMPLWLAVAAHFLFPGER
jgi:drug/metabolite transporter (DMT)-like permease